MDPSIDSPKLPDMVMCGDHPSFTKTELNEKPPDDKDAPLALPRPRPSATSLRERPAPARARASGHALRARRPERALGELGAGAQAQSGALIQAALGSFRWPPYLVAVWVCVLLLTHALHCVVGCLERALPRLRACCQWLRVSAERGWRSEAGAGARLLPAALAALAAAGYALYFSLYVVYSIALWSIEPLAEDVKMDSTTKVTDYTDASDDSSK